MRAVLVTTQARFGISLFPRLDARSSARTSRSTRTSRSAMTLDVASVERSSVRPGAASFPRRTRGNGVRGDDDASLLPIEAEKDVETYTTYQLRDVLRRRLHLSCILRLRLDFCRAASMRSFPARLRRLRRALLYRGGQSRRERRRQPVLARTRRVLLARRRFCPPIVRLGNRSRRKVEETRRCARTLASGEFEARRAGT